MMCERDFEIAIADTHSVDQLLLRDALLQGYVIGELHEASHVRGLDREELGVGTELCEHFLEGPM